MHTSRSIVALCCRNNVDDVVAGMFFPLTGRDNRLCKTETRVDTALTESWERLAVIVAGVWTAVCDVGLLLSITRAKGFITAERTKGNARHFSSTVLVAYTSAAWWSRSDSRMVNRRCSCVLSFVFVVLGWFWTIVRPQSCFSVSNALRQY